MLRIISGKYRHMIIATPNVNTTRPTTDKVREALMSALGDKLIDSTILDLFAGSGALGLESLSRGAKKAIFCDNNYLAYKTIKDNILKLLTIEGLEMIQKGNDIVIVVEDMDKDRIKINICLSEECYGNTVESKRSFVKDRTMNEYYK